MNIILLSGRLTKDNELRHTQSNKAVLNNTLAVNRRFKDSQGETQTDFFDLVFWEGRAEIVNKYTKKGDRLLIKGEMQSRYYTTTEGQNIKVYEVIVDEIEFLEPKQQSDNAPYEDAPNRNHKKETQDRFKEVEPKDFEVGDIIYLSQDDENVPF